MPKKTEETKKIKEIFESIRAEKFSKARAGLKTLKDREWAAFLYSKSALAALTKRDLSKMPIPLPKKEVEIRMAAVDDFDTAIRIAFKLRNFPAQAEILRDMAQDMAEAGLFDYAKSIPERIKNTAWRAISLMHIAMKTKENATKTFDEAKRQAGKIRNGKVRQEILREIILVEKNGDIYRKKRDIWLKRNKRNKKGKFEG